MDTEREDVIALLNKEPGASDYAKKRCLEIFIEWQKFSRLDSQAPIFKIEEFLRDESTDKMKAVLANLYNGIEILKDQVQELQERAAVMNITFATLDDVLKHEENQIDKHASVKNYSKKVN